MFPSAPARVAKYFRGIARYDAVSSSRAFLLIKYAGTTNVENKNRRSVPTSCLPTIPNILTVCECRSLESLWMASNSRAPGDKGQRVSRYCLHQS